MTIYLNKYKLIILDCDETLYLRDGLEKMPWTDKLLEEIERREIKWVIASNQGAWACSETNWKTAVNYPTPDQIKARFEAIREEIEPHEIYLAFAFYSAKSDMWALPKSLSFFEPSASPFHRKPNPGMLLMACADFKVGTDEALMCGDSEDDEGAARNAGCDFIYVSDLVRELGL